jgi:hypothetical protein
MSLSAVHRKIVLLERQMADAALAEDFEMAALLRNEIAELRWQAPDLMTSAPLVRKPPPGQMGLGTQVPVAEPPNGWKKPKKPDPMTANVKTRRGR